MLDLDVLRVGTLSIAVIALTAFLIALMVVWVMLPFAIFGTKPKLDQIRNQLQEINAQLARIAALVRVAVADQDPTASERKPIPGTVMNSIPGELLYQSAKSRSSPVDRKRSGQSGAEGPLGTPAHHPDRR